MYKHLLEVWEKRYLGREGILDDTKPLLREKTVYNKLENNDEKIRKDPKGTYEKIKEESYANKN